MPYLKIAVMTKDGFCCQFEGLTEAHTYRMPVMDEMSPNTRVMKKTTAVQNVAHSNLVRLSNHHCVRVLGRALS